MTTSWNTALATLEREWPDEYKVELPTTKPTLEDLSRVREWVDEQLATLPPPPPESGVPASVRTSLGWDGWRKLKERGDVPLVDVASKVVDQLFGLDGKTPSVDPTLPERGPDLSVRPIEDEET